MENAPKEDSHEISKELFGSKLELKKIFQTFIQVFKNVDTVVQDFHQNIGQFTRPVKYALSIMVPYIIIIQLFNIDMGEHIMEVSMQANSEAIAAMEDNPEMANFFNRYMNITAGFTNMMYEFLPAVYAVIYVPVVAFWLKKFFKKEGYRFSYYYAVGTYIMMTMSAVTFLFILVSFSGLYSTSSAMNLSIYLTLIFYTYGTYLIFKESILETIIKTVVVFLLTGLTIVIPMVVIIVSLTIATM